MVEIEVLIDIIKVAMLLKKDAPDPRQAMEYARPQPIEYWAGGRRVHGFNSVDEAAGHFRGAKPIAYGQNKYVFNLGNHVFKVAPIGSIRDENHFRAIVSG
jgi:hypothetical protein